MGLNPPYVNFPGGYGLHGRTHETASTIFRSALDYKKVREHSDLHRKKPLFPPGVSPGIKEEGTGHSSRAPCVLNYTVMENSTQTQGDAQSSESGETVKVRMKSTIQKGDPEYD